MNAAEFFNEVAKSNYQEFTSNRDSRRHLWNAIVSMNTVAEYVALDQLGYGQISRRRLDEVANLIRGKYPILGELKHCAETFKHVRKIKDHAKLGSGFTTISTSTGVSEEPATWKIGPYDLVDVLSRAAVILSSFPELK
jgi:hypothetical protein